MPPPAPPLPAGAAPPPFRFERVAADPPAGEARRGRFSTPHGTVDTPAFMPVATNATLRGLTSGEIAGAGGRMLLSNAYHLSLRPGDAMVRALGGLHAFARWDGPMLTDSGGFQVFSLAKWREVREEGVLFRNPHGGALVDYTPEHVMRVERNLGADVIMQLDELIAGDADEAASRAAMERSLRWLERCRIEFDRLGREGRAPLPELAADAGAPPFAHAADERASPPQALFPIVQGGTFPAVRRDSLRGVLQAGDWHGIAVGGLSVGETKTRMFATLEALAPLLPADRPRYLMGVGFPDDLVEAVARGIDLFDCVAPQRMGRHGTAFTPDGPVQIRRSGYRTDRRPLVEGCPAACCTDFDRAYLRHLFVAEEMLGPRLLALHNVTFLLELMREARDRLARGEFASWSTEWLTRWRARGGAQRSESEVVGGDGA